MTKDNLVNNLPSRSNEPIITPQDEKPEQVILGIHITSSQEEADTIIPYPISEVIADGKTSFQVICEEINVSSLLCFAPV